MTKKKKTVSYEETVFKNVITKKIIPRYLLVRW